LSSTLVIVASLGEPLSRFLRKLESQRENMLEWEVLSP
jgi:hypothetical protein